MLIINLAISLFSTLKVGALECVSVVNQKCMPRPKILNIDEGIGEALFYPYNVLVNKCSGSCDTLDNPMSKICVPKIIKNVNMKVYNFLMRLNETCNVLWHESCKCVCRLNSSVCNSKQTCRCDCNEDFASIIDCNKGYTWNPNTCECQCDKWCKTGQYLDHKNCVCKNKLIGRLIEECTSIINETMINNKDNIDNCNTIRNVFIVLFSVVVLIGIICFCVFPYSRWFKGKKLFKKILIIEYIKMDIGSLKIKTQDNYNWDDIIYLNDFDENSLEIIKRESKIGVNIYYIKYNTLRPFYFVIDRLIGYIEEIEGSSDKYLVVLNSLRNENITSVLDKIWRSIENRINSNIKIKDCYKF